MLKRYKKKLLRSAFFQWFFGGLIAIYVELCWKFGRYDEINRKAVEHYWQQDKPVILALWHGRLLLMPKLYRRRSPQLKALISDHPDGRLVSKAGRFFGIHTVSGSSTRGATAAVKKMLRFARLGHSLFITPDGPKGPRQHAQMGVVEIARMSGLPIIPVAISTQKGTQALKSWDHFLVPKIKDSGVIIWGEPIHIPRKVSEQELEAFRVKVESQMNLLQIEADERMCRTPTTPTEKDA